MAFIEKHKALIITLLITGIVIFGLFSIQITKQTALISESFYEIEPKTEAELKEVPLTTKQSSEASTNKPFNEDEAFKKLMENFKMLPTNDFEKTTKAIEKENYEIKTAENSDANVKSQSVSKSRNYVLKKAEAQKYKELQHLLNKKQKGVAEHAKANSSLTYSLKGRQILNYDTPRYLCERFGKVIVNINVNKKGNVIHAYINTASNTSNQCLIDHALEYAKSIRFNAANRSKQLGSITFYFRGK